MKWIIRIAIGLAVLAAALLLASRLFERQIAERLFATAVERNVGVSPFANLPDGLHVYVCGAGSPMGDNLRAGPCLGVVAGERAFVFDAGAGSIRKLSRMQFPMPNLEAFYLTHLHSDHFDGMGELMLQAWIAGARSEPLPVFGPPGTARVVEGFNIAYEIDQGYRIAHHGTGIANPDGYGAAATELAVPVGPGGQRVIVDEGDLRITVIRVDHAPVEPAFGYRVDYKGRSVSISGDTIYHPEFVAASQGVDVMLHEALDPDMVSAMGAAFAKRGNDRGEKIFSDILDYHASPEDAARSADEAGADALVIYHIVPPLPSPMLNAMFLGDSADFYGGPIRIAEDGLRITLPSGSDAITYEQVF